jgi:hypothetical protein
MGRDPFMHSKVGGAVDVPDPENIREDPCAPEDEPCDGEDDLIETFLLLAILDETFPDC